MSDADPGQFAADPRAADRWSTIRRWLVRSSVGALVLSMVVHVGLLVLAALLAFASGPAGEGSRGPAAIEFAVMPEAEFEALAAGELSIDPPSASELLVSELAEIDASLEADLSSSLVRPELTLQPTLGSGGGDLSVDGGASGGGAVGGGASFFGIEARGNRFAYIVDASGSMDRDGRMEATRRELAESITELLDHVEFFVVLYSDDARPLGDRREWTDGSATGKRWARAKIASIDPLGGTNPLPAFEIVMAIRPRPDAIYFMTDGEFDDRMAAQIIAMNRERPTPIHCITFVTDDAAELMKRIANASGGTYTHIPAGGHP
ncbi:MAG: vWA domain-containing protein [Phycisphaerales bacterium]